jgi:hypothetical protein
MQNGGYDQGGAGGQMTPATKPGSTTGPDSMDNAMHPLYADSLVHQPGYDEEDEHAFRVAQPWKSWTNWRPSSRSGPSLC